MYQWFRVFNTVNMSIIFKFNRFNIIPLKIPASYLIYLLIFFLLFVEIEGLVIKFLQTFKGSILAKTSFGNEDKPATQVERCLADSIVSTLLSFLAVGCFDKHPSAT